MDVEFDFGGDPDYVALVWLDAGENRLQPVLWPMTLHVHDQECNRA